MPIETKVDGIMDDITLQQLPKVVRKRVITTSIPIGVSDHDYQVLHSNTKHASPKGESLKESAFFLVRGGIPRATATLRTAAVFFFVGFIWHSTILPFFYKQVGPEIAALIQLSGSHLDAVSYTHLTLPTILLV